MAGPAGAVDTSPWERPDGWEEPILQYLPEGAEGLAPAGGDLYAWDPLGLVGGDDVRKYSLGTDKWEVWVCKTGVPSPEPVTVSGAVDYLNNNAKPYYTFLSEGRYTLAFQAGGTVNGDDPYDCLDKATNASGGGVEAAIVIADTRTGFGFGGPGFTCPSTVCSNQGPTMYPANGREIFAGAEAVVDVGVYGGVLESLSTHEIGHTLQWSHSYTGDEVVSGSVWEYDNPIDVMSGNTQAIGNPSSEPDSYATVGLNRYAAGWIDPTDVHVHSGGTREFVLGAAGSNNTELAVIPLGSPGHFISIDARISSAQDRIPSGWQGVSLHQIDERVRPEGCFSSSFGACLGASRRVSQWQTTPYQIGHVLEPGDSKTVSGVKVTVLSKESNGYKIRLEGGASGGSRFADTAGSVFETDIEWLADSGITKGCNPPTNNLFCPDDQVTRGQMAAFLVRALGLSATGSQNFTDTVGHVFATDIAKLAAAGITKGCNPPANTQFCPDDRVTRGQMAAFLTRAFGLTDGSGVTFSDTAGSGFETDIAKLAKAGITKGCNPPTNSMFCPHDSVTRGQMAAFLHRSEAYLP